MLVGEFDLTENLCWRWDSEFGPDEPPGPSEDDWPTEPVRNPAYFGENQKGENRHDQLAPAMSADAAIAIVGTRRATAPSVRSVTLRV